MEKHLKDTVYLNRRSGKDRRSHNVPKIKSLFVYRRRRKIRREEDKYKTTYFDQHSTKNFIAIILILFLSIIDALLTLYLIDNGASEINPVMAYFLKFGPYTFMGFKYFLTCYSIIIILIFSNYFIVKLNIYARTLFSYTIGIFLIVIGWELFLFFQIPF